MNVFTKNVDNNLSKCKIEVDLCCLLSGVEEETVLHALVTCPMLQTIWFCLFSIGPRIDEYVPGA